ncbi:hypothetical protein PPNSA23_14190 [Phyllobacterium phragmitis]|uniref:Lytic murein transglycosylase n=1 Tax=Phyllobacterium phragmitis TaxID=2670329 RepID=A0ABQ0GXT8_9HYPH
MLAVLTPLWPAGHLPLKGGNWLTLSSSLTLLCLRLVPGVDDSVISPLEGEMPGKAEGGADHLARGIHASL